MSIKKHRATELDKVLGRKLKNIRYQHNLNQSQMAKLLGVSAQQIQKYENGSNRLSLSSFILLAKALNLNINDFLDIEKKEEDDAVNSLTQKHLQRVIHTASKLNPNKLNEFINFLEAIIEK